MLSPEATMDSLLRIMECAPPSRTNKSAPVSSPAKPAETVAAVGIETVQGQGGSVNGSSKKQSAYPAVALDLTCLSRKIDFHDFLELLCRVICSQYWMYASPIAVDSISVSGSASASLLKGSSTKEADEDNDNASVYSLALSEILAERIGVWKLHFDLSTLNATSAV